MVAHALQIRTGGRSKGRREQEHGRVVGRSVYATRKNKNVERDSFCRIEKTDIYCDI